MLENYGILTNYGKYVAYQSSICEIKPTNIQPLNIHQNSNGLLNI